MDGPTAVQEGFGNVPTPVDAVIGKYQATEDTDT